MWERTLSSQEPTLLNCLLFLCHNNGLLKSSVTMGTEYVNTFSVIFRRIDSNYAFK